MRYSRMAGCGSVHHGTRLARKDPAGTEPARTPATRATAQPRLRRSPCLPRISRASRPKKSTSARTKMAKNQPNVARYTCAEVSWPTSARISAGRLPRFGPLQLRADRAGRNRLAAPAQHGGSEVGELGEARLAGRGAVEQARAVPGAVDDDQPQVRGGVVARARRPPDRARRPVRDDAARAPGRPPGPPPRAPRRHRSRRPNRSEPRLTAVSGHCANVDRLAADAAGR